MRWNAISITLAGAQVFLHVLRGFGQPGAGGVTPNPGRDLAALDQEFLMGDLIAIERAFERAKKVKLSDVGRRALARAQEALEAEVPIRLVDFPDDESRPFHHPYNLLTQVPQVLLLNLESGSLGPGPSAPPSSSAALLGRRLLLAFPFSDAAEVAALSPEEQGRILQPPRPAGGRPPIWLRRPVSTNSALTGFLTTGEDEVRARPIRRGLAAKKAAGSSTRYRARLHTCRSGGLPHLLGTRLPKACRDAGCAAPGRQGLQSKTATSSSSASTCSGTKAEPTQHSVQVALARRSTESGRPPPRHAKSTSPD